MDDSEADTIEMARRIRQALTQLGHAWDCRDGTTVEVCFRAIQVANTERLGPVALLEVDTTRLPRKVSIDDLTAGKTLHHLTAVTGCHVKVLNTVGLTYAVMLRPQPKNRLPAGVTLADAGDPSPEPYQVPIGMGSRGPVWKSLRELDCVLVAGQRGMGKSSWVNTALAWLLTRNSAAALRVALVDPKEVELALWADAPHIMGDVARDAATAETLLGQVMGEMDGRRVLFARAGVRNLEAYNAKPAPPLPLILCVVDELGDLASEAGVKAGPMAVLSRIIAKGRAFGVHAIVSTQRPDADAVAGIIKANIATRLAFWLPDSYNYKIALGYPAGQAPPSIPRTPGRMIARMADGYQTLQAFYIEDGELERIAAGLASGEPAPVALGTLALGTAEVQMVTWALADNDGCLSIENVQQFLSLSAWRSRKLAEDWEARGWLRKDPQAGNVRRVTGSLAELVERFEDGLREDPQRFEAGEEGLRWE